MGSMDDPSRAPLLALLAEWDRTLQRQRALRDQLDAMLTVDRMVPTEAEIENTIKEMINS